MNDPQDKPRLSPRLLIGITLGLVAVLIIVVATSPLQSEPAPKATAETVEASFTYFDGSDGSLSDFRGRPLVLNFWASWCPPCIAEMPDLQAVYTDYKDRVDFLGLNMQETSIENARALVEETGVTYPLGSDPDGAIYSSFGAIAMPTTVLISAEGEVVNVHGGILTADQLSDMIEEQLLNT